MLSFLDTLIDKVNVDVINPILPFVIDEPMGKPLLFLKKNENGILIDDKYNTSVSFNADTIQSNLIHHYWAERSVYISNLNYIVSYDKIKKVGYVKTKMITDSFDIYNECPHLLTFLLLDIPLIKLWDGSADAINFMRICEKKSQQIGRFKQNEFYCFLE